MVWGDGGGGEFNNIHLLNTWSLLFCIHIHVFENKRLTEEL